LLQIHYPHHPNYGEFVECIRRLRREGEEAFIVKLENGSQRSVPGWMLDPVVCAALREADSPELSLEALVALRTLLDAQPLSEPPLSASSGSLPLEPPLSASSGSLPLEQGDRNEPKRTPFTATDDLAAEPGPPLAISPGRGTGAVSSAARGNAHQTGSVPGNRRQ